MPKPMAFLYTTTTTNTEKKIVDTVSFIMASKRMPYLGIHITKEKRNFYMKTFNL